MRQHELCSALGHLPKTNNWVLRAIVSGLNLLQKKHLFLVHMKISHRLPETLVQWGYPFYCYMAINFMKFSFNKAKPTSSNINIPLNDPFNDLEVLRAHWLPPFQSPWHVFLSRFLSPSSSSCFNRAQIPPPSHLSLLWICCWVVSGPVNLQHPALITVIGRVFPQMGWLHYSWRRQRWGGKSEPHLQRSPAASCEEVDLGRLENRWQLSGSQSWNEFQGCGDDHQCSMLLGGEQRKCLRDVAIGHQWLSLDKFQLMDKCQIR